MWTIWVDGEWTVKTHMWICGNKTPTRCNRCFLLQILLFAQHVSGTIMPIIRSSRVLYKWLMPVVFGALVFKLSVWCGAKGCVSGLRLETCWASNKICNKNHLLHLVGILFPHINDDVRSKQHQTHVKLNPGLPWQKQHWRIRRIFHRQIRFKFKEETREIQQLKQGFLWCWNLGDSERRWEVTESFEIWCWRRMDRINLTIVWRVRTYCTEWRSKKHPTFNKMTES